MFEKIKEIICSYVEVDENKVTLDARFIEDLGFNSYDFMCMIGEFEDTYNVEVDERDIINVKTVGDAVSYIESLQK